MAEMKTCDCHFWLILVKDSCIASCSNLKNAKGIHIILLIEGIIQVALWTTIQHKDIMQRLRVTSFKLVLSYSLQQSSSSIMVPNMPTHMHTITHLLDL